MNPQIEITSETANSVTDLFTFTLSGVNVSLANAIRRVILSDVPSIIFRTAPYEKNKATIFTNTTRLNNEIIKQRLGCIPIHIKNINGFPLKDYIMEVNVENKTDTMMFVTTKDFIFKNVVTKEKLSEEKIREIFPSNVYSNNFIDFVRLRPKLSDDLTGEKIHLTCELDIGTAKEDGMYNVVSTCSYGYTVDDVARDAVLAKKKQQWKDEGKNADEIDFESKNWMLLDGMRVTKPNSFDFQIESVGIYSNVELVIASCEILIARLDKIDSLIEKDELPINNSSNTMSNSFDIILENEDYTIGKILEYFLYAKYYETKILTFCGFKMMHPHDLESIIRVAYKEPVDKAIIKGHLKECINGAKHVYAKIKKDMLRTVKD